MTPGLRVVHTDLLNQLQESLWRDERLSADIKRMEDVLVSEAIEKAKKSAEFESSEVDHSNTPSLM